MRQIWRSVLHEITPYQAGPSLEALAAQVGLTELTRLSANENPLGPSPLVVEAIRREAARVHLYPDGGSTALRETLAARLGVTRERVLVGNGADEVLALLAVAALEPGDEVVLPDPSFEPYTTVARLAGATLVKSPLRGYDTDIEDIRQRVTARTKIVIVCSPHNPAATIVRRGPLETLLGSLGPDGPLVVLDEAYCDFCDDPEYPDGVRLLGQHPRILVLRTFSKIAGLAGLRVGYAVGAPESIDALNRVRAPYNVNRLGQVAALAALEDPGHWERTRKLVIAERQWLSAELARRRYTVPPSQANFFLLRVPDAEAARARFLKAGLIVRDGDAVGFPGHLRISIGLPDANRRLVAVLDELWPTGP
jgi:histidinol-phosphate aminotransferase